jgi:hypothetical protein
MTGREYAREQADVLCGALEQLYDEYLAALPDHLVCKEVVAEIGGGILALAEQCCPREGGQPCRTTGTSTRPASPGC